MSFGDLKTEDGLAKLNTFLLDKSYIVGYVSFRSPDAAHAV